MVCNTLNLVHERNYTLFRRNIRKCCLGILNLLETENLLLGKIIPDKIGIVFDLNLRNGKGNILVKMHH